MTQEIKDSELKEFIRGNGDIARIIELANYADHDGVHSPVKNINSIEAKNLLDLDGSKSLGLSAYEAFNNMANTMTGNINSSGKIAENPNVGHDIFSIHRDSGICPSVLNLGYSVQNTPVASTGQLSPCIGDAGGMQRSQNNVMGFA